LRNLIESGTVASELSKLTPKCGKIKVHHWAHKNDLNCDSWREPETEWHRQWKNRFPNDWQEVVKFDKEGNKHVADVFNPKIDLVIEHSFVKFYLASKNKKLT
jgi:ribosomal protein L33